MPGVPSEMHRMYHEQVRPRLGGGGKVIRRALLNCFGLGESHTEQMLGELTARGRDPEIGITAHEATITLRILATGDSEAECQSPRSPTPRAEIRRRLGHYVFSEGNDSLEQVVLKLLADSDATLATVEAGTRGLLASGLARNRPVAALPRRDRRLVRRRHGSPCRRRTRIRSLPKPRAAWRSAAASISPARTPSPSAGSRRSNVQHDRRQRPARLHRPRHA